MTQQTERQMIIGYGISVEGRIENCERLVLDGNLSAELADVQSLIINETGSFRGNGSVKHAEIGGRFEGELIVADHITILSTGRIDGKVTYSSIEIKPGGKFTGEIILRDAEPEPENMTSNPHMDGSFEIPSGNDDDEEDYIDRALKNRIAQRPDL